MTEKKRRVREARRLRRELGIGFVDSLRLARGNVGKAEIAEKYPHLTVRVAYLGPDAREVISLERR